MKIISTATSSADQIISQALACLKAGGLVIYPTETVYGVGVVATNSLAVQKLLKYKSRREGKPISIAVNSQEMAGQYVQLNPQAIGLIRKFLPGPVTVICQSLGKVAPGVESEFGTLGIRIPDYPLILNIIDQLGQPLTATSANGSNKKRPYTITDILNHLSDKQKSQIDLIINAGQLPPNPPSTVIDTTLSTPVTVRIGSLTQKNSANIKQISTSVAETQAIAGKLLLQHWDKIKTTGLIIGLNGSLGAGKTVFAKGLAKFLQIPETITSPTYNYLTEYEFKRHGTIGKLIHVDAWKIDDLETWNRLKLMSFPLTIIVVEWYSQIRDLFTAANQNPNLPANIEIAISPPDQNQPKNLRELSIFTPLLPNTAKQK